MNTLKAKHLLAAAVCLLALQAAGAQTLIDKGWKFALGDASSPGADWGRGTEYFNYLTKAASIHNEGPYSPGFDDSSWQDVTVPHDWAATLPSSPDASHSHGYKTIGWQHPGTSVGWYRRAFSFDQASRGSRFILRFDGIYRDATLWFNGIYMGGCPSGYAVQTYDITPYIDWDGPNVLCVRADATLEEGWFYEGAGIYRNVWLLETPQVHPVPGGISVHWTGSALGAFAELENSSPKASQGTVILRLLDATGSEVCSARADYSLPAATCAEVSCELPLSDPHLWDVTDPYLYTLEATVAGKSYNTPAGIRTAEFTPDRGFLLNGRKLILKGVNLHQDHAGVGAAVPEPLMEWRLQRLKELGCNAIRCSHNPADPTLLDLCDRLGMLVIDENRLMGVNGTHKALLENMIRWGRSHPSVILWSIGNEEWGLENSDQGSRIAEEMTAFVRALDPTRRVTAANAGGTVMIHHLDVAGFNYLRQNNIDRFHYEHPYTPAVGTEETTGCGTRGYYGEASERAIPSSNLISEGWKFYSERPWTAGLFFWTGFDYRGEPNPLKYPALGSEFGILDACGFPKDEAWYLKSVWTDEPVLHVSPHWNLPGREGGKVTLTVYSNCDEVSLSVNGKSLGRKRMPSGGFLRWEAVYKPGKLVATGYRNGRKLITQTIRTTGPAAAVSLRSERIRSSTGGPDIAVVTVEVKDSEGRTVPDASPLLTLSLEGPGRIIGAGNGDPCFDYTARESLPAFGGLAQVLVRIEDGTTNPVLSVTSDGLTPGSVEL